MGISHDSVNRFLLRESYEPRDLSHEAAQPINLTGGTLSVDDSTLDKPYSRHIVLVGYCWSGKHHRVVWGLNVVTLYYTDPQGRSLPVNYRVYDKTEQKTKNEYFREMLEETLKWGLRPHFITADSWYSCLDNLKKVKNHLMGFMFAVESNRLVSIEKGVWIQVQALDIQESGVMVWLRSFREVKLFRTPLKDQLRHDIVFMHDSKVCATFDRHSFQKLHDEHWPIEEYHRMIKQVCNIETFQVRGKIPILNHIFAALCAYIHLQKMQFTHVIPQIYAWKRNLFKEVVADFIRSFVQGKEYLNPQMRAVVNA